MKDKFPLTFKIVGTLRAPEGATEEDVRRVLRVALLALKVDSVELILTGTEYSRIANTE
jgi:hypothetical protein